MAIDWDKLEANAKAKDRKHYEEGKRANAVLFQTHTSGGTSTPVTSLPLTQSMSFQRDLGVLSLGANPAMGALNTTVNKLTDTPQPLPSLPSRQTYAGQSYDQIQADIDRLNQDREQTKRLQTSLQQQMAGQSRGWTGAKSNEQLQGELDRLDIHLNSIDLGLKVADKAAEQAKWQSYSAIPSRPDYAQYAAQGAAIQNPSQREAEGVANLFGWRPGAQDVGNIVTYSRDNWESIALGEMGGSQMVGRSLYHYMTDDEVGIYNYLLAKEGKEAAQEYLDSMEETLNARFGYQQGENIRGIENPVGRALTTGAYGFGAGIEQFGSGIKQLGSSDRLPTSPTQFASSYIRENLAQEGNTLGGIGYDLLNTAGNMAPSILLSSLTGGLGAPAAAAQGVGAAALGASVGGNAYNQALAEGYNEEQARNYGVLTAASEGALQYLLGGIGALGGKLTGRAAQATIQNIDHALLRTAVDLGFSMAGEGAEEYLQTVLEPVYRNLIFDENNEVKLVSEEAAYSFLLGALSAGLMEGGGTISSSLDLDKTGRAVRASGQVDALVDHAMALDTGSQAGQMARQMRGGSLRASDINVGQLLKTYAQEGGSLDFMKAPAAGSADVAAAPEAGAETLPNPGREAPQPAVQTTPLSEGAEGQAATLPNVERGQMTTLPDPSAGGQKNTASTVREAGAYRAQTPENVELPTVPIINLSMDSVAGLNDGTLPKSGNYLRKQAYSDAVSRLGLDKHEAVYVEAENITRNGDQYVIKITKPSLKKMLSASSYPDRVVPLESIAVLSQLERIAQNGVYFRSEGDRKGRPQIAGYDHLLTTVYLDGTPYVVDMRVRVEDTQAGGANRLYHFTPELLSVQKQNDGAASTAGRHATGVHSKDTTPPSTPIIADDTAGGNSQYIPEEAVSTKKVDTRTPTGTLRERAMIQDAASTSAPIIADGTAGGNSQYAPSGPESVGVQYILDSRIKKDEGYGLIG